MEENSTCQRSPGILDVVETDRDVTQVIETEVTVGSPVPEAGTDTYTVNVEYKPDGFVVNDDTFGEYLGSFEGNPLRADICCEIFSDLSDALFDEKRSQLLFVEVYEKRPGGHRVTSHKKNA